MLANRSVLALAVGLVLVLLAAYGLAWQLYRRRWSHQEQPAGLDRRYHRDIAAVGLLLTLVAGFFWRSLFNRDVTMPPGGGDMASFFFPNHVFASASLHSGELPLWNPHLFSGMPFAADIQSGLFYPLNWLFWLAGYPITYEKVEMLALIHFWLAASFTYALARSLNLGRWPGVIAGTLYAFSGFTVSHLGHLPMLAAATWLPLALLAVNQAARPRPHLAWRWPVATGLALALSLLTGHFQLFVYNFYAALLFWLAVAWRGRKVYLSAYQTQTAARKLMFSYWRSQALRGGLALLVLLGATLVQLWPFYEMGQLSIRAAISYETSTQFGVWPVGLAELLLPDLFSPNPQEYFGYWSNTDVLGYMALFTYVLASLAIFIKSGRHADFYPVFFITWGLLGLVFSLSGYTIFQGWFYQFVPALNLTRASGRFLAWFNLGFGLAAAFGLQAWLDYRSQAPLPQTEKVLRWGWRLVALVALGIGLVPLPILYALILATPGSINDLVVRGVNGLIMAILILALSATLLRLFYHRRLPPDAAAGLVLALLVFDLFSARADFNPQSGDVANGFNHAPAFDFLGRQDPVGQYRIDASVGSVREAWQPNTAQLYRYFDVRGVFNPLQLASYETLWNAITSQQKDFRAVPAYNLLGARYVITRKGEDPTGQQFQRIFQDNRPGVQINIFENSQVLPRAWVVHQAEIKPSRDVLPALLAADFQPASVVLLESGIRLAGAGHTTPAEKVTLLSQTANRLEFDSELVSEGYVVINQAYYPGWKVRLDGAEVPYIKADYAFGALLSPPGRHKITLEFSPDSIIFGAAISLVTWLVGLGWLAWPSKLLAKRRQKQYN